MAKVEASSLESLQVLLQQNPDSLTFAHVADVLLKNGRLEDATRICEEGIRRHPYYVTGHMVLGKCYLQKKQFEQAEKEFKRVLLFDPKHLAAHKYFGDLMRQMGWDNTCESSYRKILQIDPLDETAQEVLDELSNKPVQPGPQLRPEPIVEKPVPPIFEKSAEFGESPVTGVVGLEPEPRISIPPEQSAEPPIDTVSDFKSLVPPPRPPAPSPFDEQDLFTAASDEEQRLLNPPEPPEPAPPPRSRRTMDDDKFTSILDDIFQDEVVDENQRVERSAHIEPQPQDMDYDRDFGVEDAFITPPASMPEVPRPRPPVQPPVDDFDDDILGPPLRDDRPAFTANLTEDEISQDAGPGAMNFMDIDGLEPEPPEGSAPPEQPPFRREGAMPGASLTPNLPRAARLGREAETRKSFESAVPGRPSGPPSDREKIVTPTLGEIYAAQGQFAKAIGVFELLLRKDPGNPAYRDKIEYLKKRLQETEHAG